MKVQNRGTKSIPHVLLEDDEEKEHTVTISVKFQSDGAIHKFPSINNH